MNMMQNWLRLFALIGLITVLSACSALPLSGANSGRTVGDGNVALHLTLYPVVATQVAYGINDKLDMAGFVELGLASVSLEAWLKYTLLEPESKHAVAVVAGLFSTKNSLYANNRGKYLGAIYSYRGRYFEPYFKAKLAHVIWDVEEYRQRLAEKKDQPKQDDFSRTVNQALLSSAEEADSLYMLYGFGSRIYFTQDSSIGLGFVGRISIASGGAALAPELNFNFRF